MHMERLRLRKKAGFYMDDKYSNTKKRDTPPLVSVITVVHNIISTGRKDSFIRLVESVRNQGDVDRCVEHIIIDGGSTDGTVECIAQYADKGYFSYWISEPDTGIYNAMNKGSRAAQGTYLMYINSDDYLMPNAIEKIAESVQANPADYYIADVCIVNVGARGGNALHSIWCASMERVSIGQVCCHQGLLVSKSVFMKLGMYDERYRIASDVDFTMKLYMKKYSYAKINTPIVAFSTGGVSGSQYKEIGMVEKLDIYMHYYGNALSLTRYEASFILFVDMRQWFFFKNRKLCSRIIKKLQHAKNTALAQEVYVAMLLTMFDDDSGRSDTQPSIGAALDQPLVYATLLPRKRKYAFLFAYIAKKLHVYWLIRPIRNSIVWYFEKKSKK